MGMKPRLSLRGRALQLLAQREHSRLELRRKLVQHARKAQAEALQDVPAPLSAGAVLGGPPEQGPASGLISSAQNAEAACAVPSPPEAELDLEAQVEAVLDWLQAHRHLCEERFVESRVHVRAARFGHVRIRQELAQHGLELPAEELRALQDTELARAQSVWQRKFGGDTPADPKARARQMRFLAGRGFGGDVIRRVLQGEIED